jgi:Chloroplast envelope transporter
MQVEDINARFGVDVASSQTADVAAIYGQFLEWSIPRGEAPLTGNEPDAIRR